MKNDIPPTFASQVRAGLESLSSQQEQLAEQRVLVLIKREDLTESFQKIRVQRELCAAVETALMELCRQHYTNTNTSPSQSISAAYGAVEIERNKLVGL
jgi:hypothetical protein